MHSTAGRLSGGDVDGTAVRFGELVEPGVAARHRPDDVLVRARRRELRGAPDVDNDDLYLVSSATDQNVKLRGDGGFLKLKPLLARLEDGCELFEESLRWSWSMPVPTDGILSAAALLGIDVDVHGPLDADAVVDVLTGSTVEAVRVRKRRTQYVDGDGWLEVAELVFPGARVQSLAIQSPTIAETRRIRAALDPDAVLAPLSYVDACRRWRTRS